MSERLKISLNVNNDTHACETDARMTLADCLREKLDLTGTHLGCEHGVCGACTVLADGVSIRSCLIFAVQAQGMKITTVEGLAKDGELSPLQEHSMTTTRCSAGFVPPACLQRRRRFSPKIRRQRAERLKAQFPAIFAVVQVIFL